MNFANNNPKVTVLMPVYNGEKYLREAIDSILNQTFTDFEFLIINDGSTDSSVEIINSYDDSRIRLIHNEKNLKLVASLNKGMDLARGKYIARMDCDDISLPDRIEKQVIFMDENPDIVVTGTWVENIDINGDFINIVKPPVGGDMESLYWRPSPLIHPSVMMQKNIIEKYKYDLAFMHAEDYELWLRISKKYKIDNIPEVLLKYRIHNCNISKIYRKEQLTSSYNAFQKYCNDKISYNMFLAFIFVDFKINPFYRNVMSFKYIYKYKMCKSFVLDSIYYTYLWVKKC